MSRRPVVADAVDEAGNVLRAVSSARQVYSLYPTGHPDRLRAVREVVRPARWLRQVVDVGDPVVFVARHSFYIGSKLLPRESLSLYKLIEDSPIKIVGMTREDNAGFAADAYARIHGLGCIAVTYCVGGLSACNSIAGAYATGAPESQAPTGRSRHRRLYGAQ